MPTETLTEINKAIWPFLWDNSPDLVPCEQATRPLSEGGLDSWHPRQGKVDWNESNWDIQSNNSGVWSIKGETVLDRAWRAKVRAEINIAEILKNGWAGSRLEFNNGAKTNPQGFWERAAKALKYATGDTGEPQDGPKEWTARVLYRWLRRKKDSGKFTKRVAAKWGLGEEQFKEAWKTTWESIRANNIIKGFKWRLLNKVLPTSDRLSRQGLVDAVRNCPLCGICRKTVEHMFFHCREIKAAYAFWFVLANKCMSPTGTMPITNSRAQTWSLEWRTNQEARRQTRSHQCFYTQYG